MEIFAFDINISVKESVSVKEFKQKLNHGQKFAALVLHVVILKFLSIMSVLVFC